MSYAQLENKALSDAVLEDCKAACRIYFPPGAHEDPEEYTIRVFGCMRRVYSSHYYSHLAKPINDTFDRACMEESILQTDAQSTPPAPGSVEHYLAVCKRYNQFKANNRMKKSNGETINQMEQLRDAVEPLITEAVSTLLAEFTRWVTTLKFNTKKGMSSFLNTFEKEMCNLPYLYGMRWPKNIFASFRVDFLMRDDFKKKFPCKIVDFDDKSIKFPHFADGFAYECLVGLAVLDNEAAMKKWLRLATHWDDDEVHDTAVVEALERCLQNNAHKCIGCIDRDVIVKYNGGYDPSANNPVGMTFPYMFNRWADNPCRNEDRSFGYIGPTRWNHTTVDTFDAAYKHPLADHSIMKQPPVHCALRSRWVRLVRWGKVRALVCARGFIVQVMQQIAERECHAEFAADGTALMLGATAREGRAANASLLGGDGGKARIDERACVVRGAPSEFNTMIQSTLDLVQASRLRRLQAESASEEEEEEEQEEQEEQEPPAKRARASAIVDDSDSE